MVIINYISIDTVLGHHFPIFGAKASITYPAPPANATIVRMRIFFAAIPAGYPEGLVPLSPLESLAEWQIFDAVCT